jgi:tetratricopeptide (TPR) repeat protein
MESDRNQPEDGLDDVTWPIYRALSEIASRSREHAELVVRRLLQLLNGKRPSLRLALLLSQENVASTLGFTEDDLYEIYRRAHDLYGDGDCEGALALGAALLVLTPGHGAVLELMASCCTELGRYEEALRHVEQALASWDLDPSVHLHKAQLLYRLGQIEAAAEVLRQLLERPFEEAEEAESLLEEVEALLGK